MLNKLLLALSALVLSAAICHGAEITLEEIVALHKEASQVIRSGRISYTIERRKSERQMRSTMDGAPEKDHELLLKIKALRKTYTEEVDWTFDADIDAFKERKTNKRDLAKLVDELNISEEGSFREIHRKLLARLSPDFDYGFYHLDYGNLHETQDSSVIDGISYSYWSGNKDFYIRKDKGHRPGEYLIRSNGFISPSALEKYSQVEITEDPADPNLVVLRVKLRGMDVEYVLDRSLGYRKVSMSLIDEDGFTGKTHFEYRKVGDYILPSVIEGQRFYPDGEFRMGSKIEITAAELNIPIDKSEFKLEPPPGIGTFDTISGMELPSHEQMVQERKKDLEFLLLDVLVEELAAASPTEEPAAVQGEAVEEEPEEPQAAPARETARDGGFWIVCAVLLIAVVAVLASVMRKKRQ